MTTITRQQLRDAIEAGIAAADRDDPSFTAIEAECLRSVGATTTRVARGGYCCSDLDGGGGVGCPVAQAFPGQWGDLRWNGAFTTAYDGATWRAVWREDQAAPGYVLQVTENEGSTEGAA